MKIHEVLAINNYMIGDRTVQALDARALHTALEVRTRFDDWMRRKIVDCGLLAGVHWVKEDFLKNDDGTTVLKNEDGTFARTDYTITVDAAKLIAMSSRGEPGKLVREYFLECERQVLRSTHTEATVVTDEESAVQTWASISTKYASVAAALGYSQAEARRSSLVVGYRIQQDTGYQVLPQYMLDDSDANTARALVLTPTAGVTAALVSRGFNSLHATEIAKMYSGLNSTVVNKVLINLGYQVRIGKSHYTPTEMAMEFAATSTISSGANIGRERVVGWNWNDLRFRSVIDAQLQTAVIAAEEVKKSA